MKRLTPQKRRLFLRRTSLGELALRCDDEMRRNQ